MDTIAGSVDFLVIGGGPGGYAAALHAAHLGRSVTLVDRRGPTGLGGVCLHEGCVPTKALLRLAERADDFDTLRAAGLRGDDVHVDLAAFQEWKSQLVARLAQGVGRLLAAARVSVVTGSCRFVDRDRVVVTGSHGEQPLRFTDCVIATGSRPLAPEGLPLDGETVLDSTAVLNLQQVPSSVAVIGGGSVGMELGAALAKLGSRLTMVERASQLLPMIDPLYVRPLHRRLTQLGVNVITAATVVDHAGGKALVRGAAGEQTVEADVLLAGVGRRPNSDGLGLDALGVAPDADGTLHPAPDRRITPTVAAIGDLTPGPYHAHKASAEAAVAAAALCGRPAAFQPRALPFIVHADPEIASAGLTVAQARERDIAVRTATFGLGASGWAVALGVTTGSANLVIESGTDVVLGVHLVGPYATELIAEGALAVESGATVAELSRTIHAHPTLSEQMAEVGHVAMGVPLHVAARRPRPV